jgi:hypothetical protein
MSLLTFLENGKVFRTNRPAEQRNVLLNRSI